jgi:N6-L-threonylcarbamoyladenine synthase
LKTNRIILGIETSCDDTSVAIIKETDKKVIILSHLKYTQDQELKKWGGVVPEIAARNHLLKITPLLKQSFAQAKLEASQIDLIAVTTTPGLLGPLLTGLNAAKSLSLLHKTPILPVNHLYAHVQAIHLTEDISPPYLSLLISGGHSLYLWVEDKDNFHILGSTIDDAAGEAFDKGGKLLGLGYPAGHIIDQLAVWGDAEAFSFPVGLKSSADARLSFSGLKTSLRVMIEKHQHILTQKPTQYNEFEKSAQEFYNLCASYQMAIVKALLLKIRYAIKIAQKKYSAPKNFPIVIGGGVACNSLIRSEFNKKYPQSCFVKPEYCTDNAAMIANYGRLHFDSAITYPETLSLDAKGRFINKKEMHV